MTEMTRDPFPTSSPDPSPPFSSAKPGQTIRTSVYRTKIHGHSKLITVTWSRNLLNHHLSISILDDSDSIKTCKIDLKPWYFWRKEGHKKLTLNDKHLHVYWDLRQAKFSGDPDPQSNYYLALSADDEIVMLIGDLRREASRRIGARSASIEATLVSKKEHVFGKKRFATKARFSEKGKWHEVVIECGSSGVGGRLDPQMVVRMDGNVVIHVKHLQWKFRGNETVALGGRERVEVYWDVHDWLFSPGLKHALFIFKPLDCARSSVITGTLEDKIGEVSNQELPSSSFCLFLYAWKVE